MRNQLPAILRKNGYDYRLVQRTSQKAIYEQSYNQIMTGYEVFKIRVQRARFSQHIGRLIQEKERFPCDEDFGRTAWTHKSLDSAILRYNKL